VRCLTSVNAYPVWEEDTEILQFDRPHPHVVRMFMAEKGLTDPSARCRFEGGGRHRTPEHLRRNPTAISDASKPMTRVPISESLASAKDRNTTPTRHVDRQHSGKKAERACGRAASNLTSSCEPCHALPLRRGASRSSRTSSSVPRRSSARSQKDPQDRIKVDRRSAGSPPPKEFLCGNAYDRGHPALFGFARFWRDVRSPSGADTRHRAWLREGAPRPPSLVSALRIALFAGQPPLGRLCRRQWGINRRPRRVLPRSEWSCLDGSVLDRR